MIARHQQQPQALVASSSTSLSVWHERLAHVNYQTIIKISKEHLAEGLNIPEKSVVPSTQCARCAYGKLSRSHFPTSRTRATEIGQIIHSDICEPMQTPTPSGARYYVLFKDDFSGWRVVHFIKHKSEVAELFQMYVSHFHKERGVHVRTLRSDNRGEYTSRCFQEWINKEGIRHETSAPYTPEQNGVSERDNRTIMEEARSMLHQ